MYFILNVNKYFFNYKVFSESAQLGIISYFTLRNFMYYKNLKYFTFRYISIGIFIDSCRDLNSISNDAHYMVFAHLDQIEKLEKF